MPDRSLYRRHAEGPLAEALADAPVVLIHGPRQCGKTTLSRVVGDRKGRTFLTLDDPVARAAVQADPVGFVADLSGPITLDEVQRAPELFTAIKLSVDRNRTPGRFLLTGSTNVRLVPELSDSLAGRMETVRLHPLSQCELERRAAGFLDALFAARFPVKVSDRLGPELAERVVRGGYPEAVRRSSARRRAAWSTDYLDALVQRDVRDLARISRIDALPRLLKLAAGQTARLLNVSELAGPFQLSRQTIREYVTLLARLFVLEELPPWHSNRLTRLIRSPKLHLGDTGLASALLGVDAAALLAERELLGQLLETFVYQELRRQATGWEHSVAFYHYRDKDQAEVDIVIERGARQLAGVEVKAAATVRERDFRGLRRLQSVSGNRFRCGVVLYDGETAAAMGDRLFAVPIRSLWETDR
ncbi:MAG: ATP-binding protein [Planctomycetes bacterium]|nr:ATP-binding protein [Planctomycetota bacterium]